MKSLRDGNGFRVRVHSRLWRRRQWDLTLLLASKDRVFPARIIFSGHQFPKEAKHLWLARRAGKRKERGKKGPGAKRGQN